MKKDIESENRILNTEHSFKGFALSDIAKTLNRSESFESEANMIKLLGKNNDLRTEDGVITKTGCIVMLLSTILGVCAFLIGRSLCGKALKKKK